MYLPPMQDVLFSVNGNKIKHCYKVTPHDQFSFYAKIITEWNSLPAEVRDQSSVLSLSFLIFFFISYFILLYLRRWVNPFADYNVHLELNW